MSVNKRVISFGLSEQEIDKAIKELTSYRQELLRKVDIFRERVATRIANEAQTGFNGAIIDDLVRGGKKLAQVNVTVEDKDSVMVVIANGEDAIWVEFGTGVHHNGTVGTSPHLQGAELGLTIGGYGKGFGKKETWGYYKDGELKLTHGTPAIMPMEKAFLSVCNEISQIAKEVFA